MEYDTSLWGLLMAMVRVETQDLQFPYKLFRVFPLLAAFFNLEERNLNACVWLDGSIQEVRGRRRVRTTKVRQRPEPRPAPPLPRHATPRPALSRAHADAHGIGIGVWTTPRAHSTTSSWRLFCLFPPILFYSILFTDPFTQSHVQPLYSSHHILHIILLCLFMGADAHTHIFIYISYDIAPATL